VGESKRFLLHRCRFRLVLHIPFINGLGSRIQFFFLFFPNPTSCFYRCPCRTRKTCVHGNTHPFAQPRFDIGGLFPT